MRLEYWWPIREVQRSLDLLTVLRVPSDVQEYLGEVHNNKLQNRFQFKS